MVFVFIGVFDLRSGCSPQALYNVRIVTATANGHMSDPIRRGISEDLHALSFGEAVACDYHHRPKTIDSGEVLVEAIRLDDHPQLQLNQWPDGWVLDAARCGEHSVDSLEEPTRGFEEALIRVPVEESNNVVSVETPETGDVHVLAFSPAAEGCHPMTLSQQLMDAASDDMGLSRWIRVEAMLDGGPAEPFREYIEQLIERSPEVPSALG